MASLTAQDIGNTVKLQYSKGVYHIADWAHITNAHPIPGDGIVEGLKHVGLPLGRGLLILAEMVPFQGMLMSMQSSAGSLATGSYAEEAVKMAQRHLDFCFGFIGQNRIKSLGNQPITQDFIYMTPGVGLVAKGV